VNRAEFLHFHDECCAKMRKIVASKNADYCGSGFAFENFCTIEIDGLASTEVGIWTRFRDKTARLLTFLKGNVLKVKDEKVEDTILDAANYLILLAGYLKYKRTIGQDTYEYGVNKPEPFDLTTAASKHPSAKEDPWHCDPVTTVVDGGVLGPVTVHYGQTA
jgi:hypothetical protein